MSFPCPIPSISKWTFKTGTASKTLIRQAPSFPPKIAAWVAPRGRIVGKRHVAVAVNGIVRAVTETFQSPTGDTAFSAMVPESAFVAGSNRIQAFLISGPPERVELTALRDLRRTTYSLMRSGSEEIIASSAGETVPVVFGAVRGNVDIVTRKMGYIRFVGWAADVADKRKMPAEKVLVFSNGVANHAYLSRDGADGCGKPLQIGTATVGRIQCCASQNPFGR